MLVRPFFFFFFFLGTVMLCLEWKCAHIMPNENSQISRFGKVCGKLALFRIYLAIYHLFNTRV